MPYVSSVTGSPATNPALYYSTFSHSNETAYASYYKVKLDNGVTTELTATQRSGAGRFTYPQRQTATMLVNVSGSINAVNDAQANIGRDTISGWATSGFFEVKQRIHSPVEDSAWTQSPRYPEGGPATS